MLQALGFLAVHIEDGRVAPRQHPDVDSEISEQVLERDTVDNWQAAVAVAQVGEQHVVTLAEVVGAGSVQQEQIGPEPGRYLLIHHVGVSRVVGGRLPRLVTRPAAAG